MFDSQAGPFNRNTTHAPRNTIGIRYFCGKYGLMHSNIGIIEQWALSLLSFSRNPFTWLVRSWIPLKKQEGTSDVDGFHENHKSGPSWRAPLKLLLLSLLFTACGDRIIAPPSDLIQEEQYAYFPLEIGKYVVYQVDSIVYDFAPGGGTVIDTSRTFVRETVADTLRDPVGALIYTIERQERSSNDQPWQLTSIGSAARTASQAIRTEDNLRYLKFIFPMDRRSEWDGNVWIDENREFLIAGERMRPFSNWNYEVDSIDRQALVGSFMFDSTLLITEADDNNVIERRLSRARYAKHVGLVWREQWILDSQYCNRNPPPADCATKPWVEKAEKGYILRQTILKFN